MFKQKLIIATLTILIISCSDDHETTESIVSYPIELSVSFPEKEQAFQYPGWNEKKQVAAFRTDTRYADKVLLTQSDGQYLTGTSEKEINEYTEFAFLYPASASTASSSDTLTQVLYINRQNGTLEGMTDIDYAWGTYTHDTDEEDYAATSVLTSLVSHHKFTFTENGRPIERISQVIITSPTDSLHVVAQLNLINGSVTSQSRGSIVIQNAQGINGDIYATFFPTVTALHFTISTMDGQSYEASLPQTMEFKASDTSIHPDINGHILEAARIGDYYYNDATWSTLPNESKECIGIILALDDLDGNMDIHLSESAHGRVVALQDCASQVAWCITDEDIEGIENQTILQDTMHIGSLPYLDGTQESYFSDSIPEQLNGIRINLSSGQISTWYPEGALSDFEGEKNTLYISNSSGTFAATTSCVEYGKGLYGWYLPSEGELALLWSIHRAGIINGETHPGFKDLEQFGYWTSTEYDASEAWNINFFSGMTTPNSKNSMYNVRPFIRF